MKFFEATNPLMWLFIKLNRIPYPGIHGLLFTVFSRCVLAAIQLGIFEAAKESPVTIDEIAEKTGLKSNALRSVLNILLILDYFKYKKGKYSLTRMGRKWSLKDGPYGSIVYNSAPLDDVICSWMGNMKQYLKTGHGIDVHTNMSEEEWEIYQTGMRNGAFVKADTLAEITPMPLNPTAMLDIGGSHGLYCVSMCKKYPDLEATIIDLPQAVERAEPMLKNYYSGDKIKYITGDALTEDFGENKYDLILMSHLMHHLSYEDNIKISQKAVKALKPGGFFVVQDFIRSPEPSKKLADLAGVITDIMFNIISTSQTWSVEEIKAFQESAGLKHHSIFEFPSRDLTQVCAQKQK